MWEFVHQCQEWLLKSPSVLSYLGEQRHFTQASLDAAKIGYFPRWAEFKPLPNDPPELNRLRGRVIVPVFSEFGKMVVGIAGRIPDPAVKGWWNTTFRKSSYLYGLESARREMFAKSKAYVFEGYFDRLFMAQSGLPNSVAAMSTRLGVRRVGLLARYCEEICLCFDTDANDAGALGTLQTLADMYSIGVGEFPWKVTMVKLPVGEDPDDFVHAHGLDAFLALERPLSAEVLKHAERAYEQLKWKVRVRQDKKGKQA